MADEYLFLLHDATSFMNHLRRNGAVLERANLIVEYEGFKINNKPLAEYSISIRSHGCNEHCVLRLEEGSTKDERVMISLTIGSVETALHILKRLGIESTRRIEKYILLFRLGAVQVCLEEYPHGVFVRAIGLVDSIRMFIDKCHIHLGSAVADPLENCDGDIIFPFQHVLRLLTI